MRLITLLITLLFLVPVVVGQEPTPTPEPSPTSTWLTPTPRTYAEGEPGIELVPEDMFENIAEEAVHTYRLANTEGYIDSVLWFAILLLTLIGLRNIINMIKGI
jgi:hypothetical protein